MGNYDDGTGYERDECGCAYNNRPRRRSATSRSPGPRRTPPTQQDLPALAQCVDPLRAGRPAFLLVHGSPRRINEYLFEDKPDPTFARIAAGADADVIVCGHTHKPYTKQVGETLFINVGSAGKPKDGDPRACWALIETSRDGVSVEFRRVEYDVESVAQAIVDS